MNDPELKALQTIAGALATLDEEQTRNVLLYINSRYGDSSVIAAASPPSPSSSGAAANELSDADYSDVGDFFDATDPQTEAERVLVVAYWLQAIEGNADFEAFPVNKQLKHLGHPVSNITRALDSLMNRSPRLVMQTGKRGSAQQARKRYKLTRAGLKEVKKMLGGNDGGNDGE